MKRRGSDAERRYRDDPSKSFVGFLVGGVQYAMPIASVREVAKPLPLVELPHAPHAVVGVAEYRGEVIPVVDLRVRFDQPFAPPTRKTKWIVAMVSTRTLALVVDSVTEVFGTAGGELRPAPVLGTGDAARGLAGVTTRSGLVFVLDASRLAELTEPLVAAGRVGVGVTPSMPVPRGPT
jgi:purine-binding chemotaxis protein CheW